MIVYGQLRNEVLRRRLTLSTFPQIFFEKMFIYFFGGGNVQLLSSIHNIVKSSKVGKSYLIKKIVSNLLSTLKNVVVATTIALLQLRSRYV